MEDISVQSASKEVVSKKEASRPSVKNCSVAAIEEL
jgi:hypothetical protein